jgi:hypothetical protein
MKVNLITPPEQFENSNPGILLMDLSETEQNEVTDWISKHKADIKLNIYYYQDEANVPWLLHAMHSSEAVYVNTDCMKSVGMLMSSYIISHNHVFYSATNPTNAETCSYINKNRVANATEFLESVFNANQQSTTL